MWHLATKRRGFGGQPKSKRWSNPANDVGANVFGVFCGCSRHSRRRHRQFWPKMQVLVTKLGENGNLATENGTFGGQTRENGLLDTHFGALVGVLGVGWCWLVLVGVGVLFSEVFSKVLASVLWRERAFLFLRLVRCALASIFGRTTRILYARGSDIAASGARGEHQSNGNVVPGIRRAPGIRKNAVSWTEVPRDKKNAARGHRTALFW